MFKYLKFFIFTFISIFVFNCSFVYASVELLPLVVTGTLGAKFYQCSLNIYSDYCTNVEISPYNKDLAIFDPFGYDLPACNGNYYIVEDNEHFYTVNDYYHNFGVTKETLCYGNYSPSLDKLLKYFPYVVRFNYSLVNDSNNIHYIYYFFESIPQLSVSTNRISFSNVGFAFTNFPDSFSLDNNILANDTQRYYYNGTYDYLTYYSTRDNVYYGSYFTYNSSFPTIFLTNLNTNGYFNVTLSANFDLSLVSSPGGDVSIEDTIINYSSNLVNDFEFGTDLDLTIPYDKYLFLVPKKTIPFQGYLWSDSVFSFEIGTKISSDYESIKRGYLGDLSYKGMNDYPWFKWSYSYDLTDINNNTYIKLYNQRTDSDLHIKIFNSDFYYKIYDKDSSGVTINGVYYPNDWQNMHDLGLNSPYNIVFNDDSFDNTISFIRDIPNQLGVFKNCFILIGTLFTTFFSSLDSQLFAYFIILFGLMIIMLIISIMK